MKVFVSYCRADNSYHQLLAIEADINAIGYTYIDDLHCPRGVDRNIAVHHALANADIFLAVESVNYLFTSWTRYEFAYAIGRGVPILVLTRFGRIVNLGQCSVLPFTTLRVDWQESSNVSRQGQREGPSARDCRTVLSGEHMIATVQNGG